MLYEIYTTGFLIFGLVSPLDTLQELSRTYKNFHYKIEEYDFTFTKYSITVSFPYMNQEEIDKALALIKQRGFKIKEIDTTPKEYL